MTLGCLAVDGFGNDATFDVTGTAQINGCLGRYDVTAGTVKGNRAGCIGKVPDELHAVVAELIITGSQRLECIGKTVIEVFTNVRVGKVQGNVGRINSGNGNNQIVIF